MLKQASLPRQVGLSNFQQRLELQPGTHEARAPARVLQARDSLVTAHLVNVYQGWVCLLKLSLGTLHTGRASCCSKVQCWRQAHKKRGLSSMRPTFT